MPNQIVNDPLNEFLRSYCHVNIDTIDDLRDDLKKNVYSTATVELFRRQLSDAIRFHTITPRQFQKLTGDNEYNTQEELNVWLRGLWKELFDEEFK